MNVGCRSVVVLVMFAVVLGADLRAQPPDDAAAPRPARNDVVRDLGPADEVLMLRHQYLDKGTHELYYRASLLRRARTTTR